MKQSASLSSRTQFKQLRTLQQIGTLAWITIWSLATRKYTIALYFYPVQSLPPSFSSSASSWSVEWTKTFLRSGKGRSHRDSDAKAEYNKTTMKMGKAGTWQRRRRSLSAQSTPRMSRGRRSMVTLCARPCFQTSWPVSMAQELSWLLCSSLAWSPLSSSRIAKLSGGHQSTR